MIEIRTDSRLFVCGKTGSGKSWFVKKILWPRYNGIKIYHDPKHEEIGNSKLLFYGFYVYDNEQLLTALQNNRREIIYIPRIGLDYENELSEFNRMCEILYKWGNTTLFIDECGLISNQFTIQQWHREILVRGRTRNVGLVNITQRPKEIPNLIITEAEHQFIFKLNLDTDIIKMKGSLPRQYHEQMYSLKPYHFIYTDIYGNSFIHEPIK